jgi:hypothetical protein
MQYINNFQINCFLSITLKFILSLVSRGLGALQGNFGTGVQLKLRKHPNAYIADSNFLLGQNFFFGPANAGPHFRHCIHFVKSKLLKGQFIPGGNLIF